MENIKTIENIKSLDEPGLCFAEKKQLSKDLDNEGRPVEMWPRWPGIDDEIAEDIVHKWMAIYRNFEKEALALKVEAESKGLNMKFLMLSGNNPLRNLIIQFIKPD